MTGAERTAAQIAPLSGMTVIDFTRVLSGPYATMLLADLGADVIKVERPVIGDETRAWGPPFWNDTSTYFAAVNRGKRSVVIDLGTESGRDVARALVSGADVVVENFRPGVASRLGIASEDVCAVNPGLVYASINGFGSNGPRAQQAGTEVIVEAESGLMAMMGLPGGPPVRFGVAMVDITTGLALVSGVLAALLERVRTGRGRVLEFPLLSTAMSVLATVIASASVAPEVPQTRFGSGHPSIVPYSAFEGADGWIVLGAISDDMWLRLCEALDLQHFVRDPAASTNEARVRHRALVEAKVAAAVRPLPVTEVVRRLSERGVLVAPVRSVVDAVRDPQIAVLGLLDDDDGALFARTPLAQFNDGTLGRAPRLGEHSEDVLRAFGFSDERRAELRAASIVHQTEPGERPLPLGFAYDGGA